MRRKELEFSADLDSFNINNGDFDCKQLNYEDLKTIKNLGCGAYGSVNLVKHTKSGKLFAVKRMTMALYKEGRDRSLMEIQVASDSRDCPFTVNFLGYLNLNGELWMFMESMDMSLNELKGNILNNTAEYFIPEEIIGNISFQITSGLYYLLNDLSILHRDVKPSNILIKNSGRVKICDFGISCKVKSDEFQSSYNVGTMSYMAPERLQSDSLSQKSDIWSLGITVLEFTTGKFPYRKWSNIFEALNDLCNQPTPALPPKKYSAEFNEYLNSTLNREADKRKDYINLLKMNFLVKNKEYKITEFLQIFIQTTQDGEDPNFL
ncbi:unnamed protein product [Dimorphilus gyrociliatus]|uniref:mitogen-activated protein kinase kinase n=1 Tax=Dimorphilus gyrociliatus TaxID=2664684 RepID=A0A7I8VGC8_9ANNE|nr:unnamed protein product [Dimorphilus gyrociliatus]